MTNLNLITTIIIASALSAAGAAYYVKTEIGQEPMASPAPVAAQPIYQTPASISPAQLADTSPSPQKVVVETKIIEKDTIHRKRHDNVAELKAGFARLGHITRNHARSNSE